MNVTLTEDNFAATVHAKRLVLLNFRSDFCGPCKVQTRVLEQLNEKYTNSIVVGEINSHEHSEWVEAFGVQSTPTTFLFFEGTHIAKLTGVHTLSKIEQIIWKAGVHL